MGETTQIVGLTLEEQTLFALSRRQISDVYANFVAVASRFGLNWDVIYNIAAEHQIAPLIYSNLCCCPAIERELPEGIASRFQKLYFANVIFRRVSQLKAVEALGFLRSRFATDVMLLKGVAMDHLIYRHPGYTIGDIDLMLRLGREALTAENLGTIWEFEGTGPYEIGYFSHHDCDMNGLLPVRFEMVWRDAKRVDYHGEEAWVMSDEDLLISLCINSCRKRYFRLKSLCDIAELLNERPSMDWNTLVIKAAEYRCRTIVFAALLATKLTVGCEIPTRRIELLVPESFQSRLVAWLASRMSFSDLRSLYSGCSIRGRRVGPSLLLPYVSYGWRWMRHVATAFERTANSPSARTESLGARRRF